jgi:hypothetical protein
VSLVSDGASYGQDDHDSQPHERPNGTAKTETAKTETAKTETAKTETAKTETAKTETAKTETAKTETAKTETERAEGLSAGWSRCETVEHREKNNRYCPVHHSQPPSALPLRRPLIYL